MDKIYHLNVSGVTEGFTISWSTLCSRPWSKLALMFSSEHDLKMLDNKVFIDRDPLIFRHLINYLRTNQTPVLEDKNEAMLFNCELIFWDLIEDNDQQPDAKPAEPIILSQIQE
jgi:hypothetical protein